MTSRFSFGRLRQRDWAVLFIVLSIVGAALWYWFLYRPTQQSIDALQAELTRLDTQIERGEAARRNLPTLRLAVSELEQDRRDFLAQLPTESEVADVIDALRTSADDAAVVLNGLTRGGGSDEDVPDVRPIGLSMTTTGTFAETMTFLSSLETLERFTKIDSVSLAAFEQVDDPQLSADFGFTVYVFTGDDPGDPEVQP
jgi:Tfp pilus assembly protein PilO